MPQYAQFDSTKTAPVPVSGWIDTDNFPLGTMPAASNLLLLTEAQWAERMNEVWAVSGGALVSYIPPPPALTAAQQLAQQAAALIAGGLAVTSTATAALSGTYAADTTTISYVNSELNSILLNGTFADGTSTVEWPDSSGTLHAFDVAQFKTLAAALGAFVAGIRKCMIGVAGATLPAATAAIP